jgi:hypothetical protein
MVFAAAIFLLWAVAGRISQLQELVRLSLRFVRILMESKRKPQVPSTCSGQALRLRRKSAAFAQDDTFSRSCSVYGLEFEEMN